MSSPDVELLYWRECPSWQRALAMTRAEVAAAGLDPEAVRVTEIETDVAAETIAFAGSPTIRIDGDDIQDPGRQPTGLTCRTYRRRDGRVSPLPDPEDLRDALRRRRLKADE